MSYAELHAHSYFSLLDGASSPETLVQRAADLGMPALALTDHDALYGAVRFDKAARDAGIKPIFGAELTLENTHHLTVLVQDATGWQNLCTLISLGRANAPKGESCLPFEALAAHTDGLIALSGCDHGELSSVIRRGDWTQARSIARRYRDLFGRDRYWIELQNHLLPGTAHLNRKLTTLAAQTGIGIVATNNVHYAHRAEHRLQDVLVCIRHGLTIDQSEGVRRPNSEYFLKSAQQMAALFPEQPDALTNTARVAVQCDFRPYYGLQSLPDFPIPDGQTAANYLRDLCEQSAHERFGELSDRVRTALDHELALIVSSGLANYFLIVWDIVGYARQNAIRCQGRGSAANSLVAYLLHISPINPLDHDLVFERFLSQERPDAPDIDIDFQADRREAVIQYVYSRYGHDHAAMACTFITFRHKSAIREVGKALGLPIEIIDSQARQVHARNAGKPLSPLKNPNDVLTFEQSRIWGQVQDITRQILDLPRHLGIHNGGMVITGTPIAARVPTEPATMPERWVIQWDKDSLEAAGLIKIDILGLRMLSAIAEALRVISSTTGEQPIDLDRLTFDDTAVYDLICAADTIGIFQVESRAQAQVLPRLRPRKFTDLIISISLIRPGPVQGNMVHPYLRRRSGEEPVRYAHPLLEPALAETLGVILFQEQILKIARDLGGLTAGQGEQLRRTLGKANTEKIADFQTRFVDNAADLGVTAGIAETVFRQLESFGGYSFPKSHAAAFAVVVYQSAWLKTYYPAALYIGLLNNQPMGFWSPAVIVGDARRHGIAIRGVDLNLSDAICTLEGNAIRLGFNYVKRLGKFAARLIIERDHAPFRDLADFCRRVPMPRALVEHLILIGAMDEWGASRRQLLWTLAEIPEGVDSLPIPVNAELLPLPLFTTADALAAEYRVLGLSTGPHLMTEYRTALFGHSILGSADLGSRADGEAVQVAGVVVVHQSPPTAKGHHFVTLEDEHGLLNIIFRPLVYDQYGDVVLGSPLLLVQGTLQWRGEVVNVIASGAAALSLS